METGAVRLVALVERARVPIVARDSSAGAAAEGRVTDLDAVAVGAVVAEGIVGRGDAPVGRLVAAVGRAADSVVARGSSARLAEGPGAELDAVAEHGVVAVLVGDAGPAEAAHLRVAQLSPLAPLVVGQEDTFSGVAVAGVGRAGDGVVAEQGDPGLARPVDAALDPVARVLVDAVLVDLAPDRRRVAVRQRTGVGGAELAATTARQE